MIIIAILLFIMIQQDNYITIYNIIKKEYTDDEQEDLLLYLEEENKNDNLSLFEFEINRKQYSTTSPWKNNDEFKKLLDILYNSFQKNDSINKYYIIGNNITISKLKNILK